MFSRTVSQIVLVFLLCVGTSIHTDDFASSQNGLNGSDPMDAPVAEIRVREGFGHLYRGAQQQGELCLHRLAQTALREDAWIYMEGFWVDVGYDEEPRGVNCTWEAVRSLPDITAGRDLVWYHIHPQAGNPNTIHPPSCKDIIALARLKMLCGDAFDSRLTGKVLDGAGVWIVDLSEEARQRLCSADASMDQPVPEIVDPRDVAGVIVTEKRQRDLARLAFFLSHEQCVQEILENPAFQRSEAIRQYVLCVNQIGVLLSYQEQD
jgi:hypothetical protein